MKIIHHLKNYFFSLLRKSSLNTFISLLIFCSCSAVFFEDLVYADTFLSVTLKKTETKRKYNWSLSDWLETKQIMSFQDMWLARNMPSPFEFYLEGSLQFQNSNGYPNQTGWEGGGAAYATFVGLEARYEKQVNDRFYGLFNLRLFGYHNQGTNLTIQGGLKKETMSFQSFFNPLAGANLTLYVNKAFGIEAKYQKFFQNATSEQAKKLGGSRYQAGIFIDYSVLRVFGDYFSDSNDLIKTSGFITGCRLYL